MTLQSLIDGATAGDVIDVSGQTFSEGAVSIPANKRLQIIGPATLNSTLTGSTQAAIGISATGISTFPIIIDGLAINGAGYGIATEGTTASPKEYLQVKNCTFRNQRNASIALYVNSVTPGYMRHILIEGNDIDNRANANIDEAFGVSPFIARDELETGGLNNILVRYNVIDQGNQAKGHFGLEWRTAFNSEICHNIFRGGDCLTSFPACDTIYMHHNEYDQRRPSGGGANSGPLWSIENATSFRATIEYNWMHGSSTADNQTGTAFIEHNWGADANVTQKNRCELHGVGFNCGNVNETNGAEPGNSIINNYVANVGTLYAFNQQPGFTLANNDTSQIAIIPLRLSTHRDHVLVHGESVTVEGIGFGATEGSVEIGGTAQDIISWSATSITFTCNQGALAAGAYDLQVMDASANISHPLALTLEGVATEPTAVSASYITGIESRGGRAASAKARRRRFVAA